ncbi:MAG: hypothetical protein ABIO40_03600 [Devosia sp.]
MNVQWVGAGAASHIVEFHNIRVERGRAADLLPIVPGHDTSVYFAVAETPDRLMAINGYTDLAYRRRALLAAYADPGWPMLRRQRSDAIADESVHLMRALNPGGLRLGPAPRACLAIISELRFQEQIGNYHLWLRLFLRKAGMDPFASFATLEMENEFPAVPVRRNRSEHIALMRPSGPVPPLPPELRAMLRFQPECLMLEPQRLRLR